MALTPHFSVSEFRCHDGTKVPDRLLPNLRKLATNLEVLREALGGKPIKINSGYRTPKYNLSIDGSSGSQHMYARAADIVVEGVTPKQVADKIEELIKAGKMHNGGLGRYSSFTHYDVRASKARWRG